MILVTFLYKCLGTNKIYYCRNSALFLFALSLENVHFEISPQAQCTIPVHAHGCNPDVSENPLTRREPTLNNNGHGVTRLRVGKKIRVNTTNIRNGHQEMCTSKGIMTIMINKFSLNAERD